MDSQFATAMNRALEQTRAGNPAGAARIIQAALGGGHAPQADTAPSPSRSVPTTNRPSLSMTPLAPTFCSAHSYMIA